MIELSIKGNKWYYFSYKEEIPLTIKSEGINWEVEMSPSLHENIWRYKNLRTLVRLGVPDWKTADTYYLYWYDEVDSHNVDESLLAGHINQNFFKNSVILDYMELSCIRGCNDWWHALIMPTLLYLEPDDVDRKQINKNIFFQHCPTCKALLPKETIKILSKSKRPR